VGRSTAWPIGWSAVYSLFWRSSLGLKLLSCVVATDSTRTYFCNTRVGSMVSVDFDAEAVDYARRHFRAKNVTYELADIRTQMPNGIFNNVVWDAAIEPFTKTEIADLMANIKKSLTPTGILSGFTIVERSNPKECEILSVSFPKRKVLRRSIPIGTIFIFGRQTESFHLRKNGRPRLNDPERPSVIVGAVLHRAHGAFAPRKSATLISLQLGETLVQFCQAIRKSGVGKVERLE
jgi:hypothetical protein